MDRAAFAVIVEPTLGEDAHAYLQSQGRSTAGIPPEIRGYLWCVRDVVHMVDARKGRAATRESAEAAGLAALVDLALADSDRVWLDRTGHRRRGRTSLEALVQEGY